VQGYDILDRNWRCAVGELDIVAAHGGDLVVVEVKTRRTEGYGHPSKPSTLPSATVSGGSPARGWRHIPRLRVDVGCASTSSASRGGPATGIVEHLVDLR
jgi:putative endonuclease